MWHPQVTSLTLRLYSEPGGYEKRLPYAAVMQVEMLGDGVAFIHAAHGEISLRQWREMVRVLRKDFGITKVTAERKQKDASYDPSRF